MNDILFCRSFDYVIRRIKDKNSPIIGEPNAKSNKEYSIVLDTTGSDPARFIFHAEEYLAMAAGLVIRQGFPYVCSCNRTKYSSIRKVISSIIQSPQPTCDTPIHRLSSYNLEKLWIIHAQYDYELDNNGRYILIEYNEEGKLINTIRTSTDTQLFEPHLRQQLLKGFTETFGELRNFLGSEITRGI